MHQVSPQRWGAEHCGDRALAAVTSSGFHRAGGRGGFGLFVMTVIIGMIGFPSQESRCTGQKGPPGPFAQHFLHFCCSHNDHTDEFLP